MYRISAVLFILNGKANKTNLAFSSRFVLFAVGCGLFENRIKIGDNIL